jgi:hypothetical protein
MKRHGLMVAVFVLSAAGLWVAPIPNVMASTVEAVTFSCLENNPGSGYSVINYNHNPGAPAQSSSDCATELEALLNAGLTNVNVTVQTYIYTDTTTGGAPGGVAGTYITYKVTGTFSSPPTQPYEWLPSVLQLLLQ